MDERLVVDLDAEVLEELERRARAQGHSAGDEARNIISGHLLPQRPPTDAIAWSRRIGAMQPSVPPNRQSDVAAGRSRQPVILVLDAPVVARLAVAQKCRDEIVALLSDESNAVLALRTDMDQGDAGG